MAVEAVATRRRIIPRPRLTKLLDDSPARIKLLIAPAGYGKTTLAQQWLAEGGRVGLWYRAGPAAADVAALAAGLSKTVDEAIANAGRRMRERIRSVGHPEDDVALLAELFAEDISTWPRDAWLVLDDYQYAMNALPSERFVELLTEQTDAQILITSRRRPTWAAPRRIVYGELQEVDRRMLAMSQDEAGAVLGRSDDKVAELLEQAAGWPAVIGLAALNLPASLDGGALTGPLYDYLAEEVVSTGDSPAPGRLATLALARTFDASLARALLGPEAAETLRTGVRSGVLQADARGAYEVHPLLGEFLEAQLRRDRERAKETARSVAQSLLDDGRFDDAFDLAVRFGDAATTEQVLAGSFDRLLREGRLATITRWLEQPPLSHSSSPVVFLAEAETAYRQGQHVRALELATQAASRLSTDAALKSRALTRAGQSALMASRETEALRYFDEARATARTHEDVREALIGAYFAASEFGLESASHYLAELTQAEDGSPETSLRIEAARLTQATRIGGIASAVERALPKRRLVDGAADPLASTAFLHMLANALTLAGRYDEAAEMVDAVIAISDRYRISMPMPHAHLNQAMARHGLRQYSAAHAALNSIADFVGRTGDTYLEFSARAIRARILTSEGRVGEALQEIAPSADSISSPPLLAEYLVSQALAYAAAGEIVLGGTRAADALSAYPTSVEARVIGACVDAITAGDEGETLARKARDAWEVAQRTGNVDGLVCSYRAWPPLLTALYRAAGPEFEAVVLGARDVPLARRSGIRVRNIRNPHTLLTPREAEVLDLLRSGLSNRAIAQTLVVSEATVKVHLRHIYEKMGVHTRAEALAQGFRR